jgi:ABC-2 type transport system permease protein
MTAIALPAVHPDVDAPIPFARLVRNELRKLTDTRASRVLLAAIVAITPVVVAVMLLVAKPKDLTYEKFVDFTQTPQKILLPALGLLSMTTEWSQRTGLVTFTLVPDRRRVILAKFTATLCLGLVSIAIAFAAAGVGNLLSGLRDGNGSWSYGPEAVGGILLVQLIGLVEGMAFGMALLVTAAAVVAYYVLPNVVSAVFGSITALKDAEPWVDLQQAQGPLYSHDMTGTNWLQLLVTFALWVVVPLAVGIARVTRTEVKSG